MQIANVKITAKESWEKLETLIANLSIGFTFQVGKTYQLSNNGAENVLIVDSVNAPLPTENVGKPFYIGDNGFYEKDSGELFVKIIGSKDTVLNFLEVQSLVRAVAVLERMTIRF